MPLQPCLDLGMLVGGIIVGDQVHVEMLRRLDIDPAQEPEPLLVPGHALADHLASGNVEGSEQGGGAMRL